MKGKYTLLLFIMLWGGLFYAQPANVISMSDAILKGRSSLAPANLRQLAWLPGTEHFVYQIGNKIVRTDAKNLETDTLDILPLLNENLQKMSKDPLKSLPLIVWTTADTYWFRTMKEVYKGNLSGDIEQVNWFSENAENIDFQDNTLNTAYTIGDELWVSTSGTALQVAKSESDGIVYGKSVHRDEFGIHKGTFWSNVSQKLAFYRMDERNVTQYPIYVLDSMPAQSRMVRYPYSGAKSHTVQVGIFDVKTARIVYLETTPETPADTEHYLTNIAWTPDDQYILIAIVNRAQNHLWMKMYHAETGKFVRTLFEEKHEKYVEPEQPPHFIPNQPNEFLWESERDGFNHLYRYNLSGKMLGQVSKGNFPVVRFQGFSDDGKTCFYQTADVTGLNRELWTSEIATGKMTKLTPQPGVHNGIFQPAGKYFIDNFTDLATPRMISVAEVKNPQRQQLFFGAKNPLEGLNIGQTRLVEIPSLGGFQLNGRLILPPDFSPAKKYPAIIYTYNGPHLQLVTNSWLAGGELWMHRMAQLGYVVFSLDGRGSSNRGLAFENAIHRQCGTPEVEDQLTGLSYLKAQSFIDGERVGIFGWSYGGFMATSLMTRPEAKGAFRCGVAGGPVIDWRMYEIMYTERYMDTPQENPEGYEKSSLFNYIDNLEGKLLMIHGSSDDVVLWQHSLRYIQACVRKGKQIDYFVYPEHAHNVFGKERVHLFEKIERYFREGL